MVWLLIRALYNITFLYGVLYFKEEKGLLEKPVTSAFRSPFYTIFPFGGEKRTKKVAQKYKAFWTTFFLLSTRNCSSSSRERCVLNQTFLTLVLYFYCFKNSCQAGCSVLLSLFRRAVDRRLLIR